jgi:hypothetical protein
MMTIPYYYKPYIVTYLERKNLWTVEDNFNKKLFDDNVNESILNLLRHLVREENERISTIGSMLSQNKSLHSEKQASCCNVQFITQSVKQSDEGQKESDNIQSFLAAIYDINSSVKKLTLSEEVVNLQANDSVEIEHMGDYQGFLKKTTLRSPYLFEDEVKEFKGDYFGNPFRRSRLDISASGMNVANIGINDGELLMLEEELSVMQGVKQHDKGGELTVVSLRQNLSEDDNDTEETFTNVKLADDLVQEFKDMFNKDIVHLHSGLKISIPMSIEMKELYDHKFNLHLKDSKYRNNIVSQDLIAFLRGENRLQECFKYLDNLINDRVVFYTIDQKNRFIEKVIKLCEILCEDHSRLISIHLNNKLRI